MWILAYNKPVSGGGTGGGTGGETTSDIVSLLKLPRAISEYTNDHIGEIISIPYTDESGKILLNNGGIDFEVVGVNHHLDVTDSSKPTITLMTKNTIRAAFIDAKEPNNPDSDRANYGNNRWSVSNIRQWLNSRGAANSWFIKQHDYDEAPDKTNAAAGTAVIAYADKPGFLAGFSSDVLQHFTDITNTTALCKLDGGGSETTVDKVFLPSYTEMGFGNNNGIAEGTHLSVRYPDDNSRFKTGCNNWWWMRSPDVNFSHYVWFVHETGTAGSRINAYDGILSIAPIIVLH